MDIAEILFYNGGTVHSGDILCFLSRKDTMYTEKKENKKENKKSHQFVAGIAAMLIACGLTGCTSKDEIVLELEKQESAQEQLTDSYGQADLQTDSQSGESEQSSAVDITSANAGFTGSEQKLTESVSTDKIYVHICGAVEKPGVYELDAGSRVYEVIEAAEGFTEEAYGDYVNQAELLQDGQKITIPTLEEVELAKAEGTFQESWTSGRADGQETGVGQSQVMVDADNSKGLVNINTATESELCSISGIGASRAAAIVKYRQENGNFASIEDIMKVSGIKEGTYEKIKDMITVK